MTNKNKSAVPKANAQIQQPLSKSNPSLELAGRRGFYDRVFGSI